MKLLILLLLLYLLYRIGKSLLGSSKMFQKKEQTGAIDEMVQDPQCKTYIPLRQAKREIIDGKEHFFCSDACANAFKEDIQQQARSHG